MKKTLQISTLLLLMVTVFSCSNTEKILVRKDGTWNIDKQIVTTDIGGVQTTDTYTDNGTVTFKDDGSGTILYNDGTTDDFTWSVSNDIIVVTDASGTAVSYDILDSSKDSQHWSGSYSFTIAGFTTTVTTDMTLSSLN